MHVITDSFHGTALSVIFEKEFYAVNDRLRDGSPRNDARITNLLEALGLEQRHVPAGNLKEADTEKRIDYAPVTEKRREMAAVSAAWLKAAIRE